MLNKLLPPEDFFRGLLSSAMSLDCRLCELGRCAVSRRKYLLLVFAIYYSKATETFNNEYEETSTTT